ncbi:MAG TPA: nucleoside hydrolase-like domain-containing protein [Verrucomicrobiae bacterium]
MKRFLLITLLCLFSWMAQAADAKPRLLVLTDIGGDPDDQQSMIRLLLYANEFEIEGLIASASGTPGELKEKVTKPELIRQLINAYGQVQPNLIKHAERYPTAEHLLSLVKSGNPNRGRDAIGEGKDNEGSRWLIAMVDKQDTRPLNISIWGGQTDFAQALWRVRKDRGVEGYQKFISKLRIYDINDQDKIVDWIFAEFPGLWYILAQAPTGQDKRTGTYRGVYLGGDESLTSPEWINQHVKENHGPLGALYPMKTYTAPNPHKTMKEGDTPSWFYFLANGLSDAAHPEWGGWGGRFKVETNSIYRDVADSLNGTTEPRVSVWRWRPAFQNDFAARMDWCAKDFAEANHAPQITINGAKDTSPLKLSAKPGETVALKASATDPDQNTLTYKWWIYPEASTHTSAKIDQSHLAIANLSIPENATSGDIHILLEVIDNGSPALTAYRRVIVSVKR